jgi:Na+/melibiose symporter-like transporter
LWVCVRGGGGAGGAPPRPPPAGTPGFDLAPTYATLSLVVVGVGSACTLFFLAGTPERAPLLAAGGGLKHLPPKQAVGGAAGGAAEAVDALQAMRANSAAASAASAAADAVAEPLLFPEEAPLHAGAPSHHPPQMTARDWLGQRSFFQVMAVYSLTRLATNVSQVYLSFFVTDSLGMDQTAIALVPLLLYLAQLSATLALKPVAERFGRRNSMTLGAALVGSACGLMLVLDRASANGVYFAMLLLGAGSAICMVISVSLESDLIGGNTESGAFVYGACSFADKLSNGIAIIAVQFAGDGLAEHSDAKGAFIRLVNGLVPLLAIAAATAVCWTISFPRHLQSRAAQQLRDEPVPDRRRSLAEPLVASAAFDGGERSPLMSAA